MPDDLSSSTPQFEQCLADERTQALTPAEREFLTARGAKKLPDLCNPYRDPPLTELSQQLLLLQEYVQRLRQAERGQFTALLAGMMISSSLWVGVLLLYDLCR